MKLFAYFIAAAVAAGICFGTGALWAKRKPDLTATAAQPRPKERGVLRFAPSAPQLAMLAIDVEKADYWANPASAITYALAYVKARVTGKSPSPGKIAESKSVRFHRSG